jgi:excinuclease UvrABC nuclease subunit
MNSFQIPYINKKTTKRFTFGQPGIYIIRSIITNKITYIGMSATNVYKALYRHFQTWNDRKQRRVVYLDYHNYEIRVILCNREQAVICERRLIKWYKPIDNAEFYEDWDFNDITHNLNLEPIEYLKRDPSEYPY